MKSSWAASFGWVGHHHHPSVPLQLKLQQNTDHWGRMKLNAVRVNFDNSVLETEATHNSDSYVLLVLIGNR